MPPREPTRHQLSSRLAYNSQKPSFLLKLQNQVAGRVPDEEDEPQFLDGGVDEFGRERRPPERRPPIPERPENDERASDDEDDADEKPVVVVLKEGKHLTELEAKNEKRKGTVLSSIRALAPYACGISLS
ncbi:hypothetical protein K439DRAFT_1628428 [Ramaria rubella]|nr:hypothetical protein K439DRAFT_1628428 [Ramaria rubella]